MKLKSTIAILSTAIIFTACGDGTSSQVNNTANKAQQTTNQPTTTFNKRVVNNKGTSVEEKIDNYTVKIFSDEIIKPNPKDRHKGVAIKINGKFKKTIPIEDAYTNKTIVVKLYGTNGKEVASSDIVQVTDDPVVVVDLSI